jgi:regulator of replication initiation timing
MELIRFVERNFQMSEAIIEDVKKSMLLELSELREENAILKAQIERLHKRLQSVIPIPIETLPNAKTNFSSNDPRATNRQKEY